MNRNVSILPWIIGGGILFAIVRMNRHAVEQHGVAGLGTVARKAIKRAIRPARRKPTGRWSRRPFR